MRLAAVVLLSSFTLVACSSSSSSPTESPPATSEGGAAGAGGGSSSGGAGGASGGQAGASAAGAGGAAAGAAGAAGAGVGGANGGEAGTSAGGAGGGTGGAGAGGTGGSAGGGAGTGGSGGSTGGASGGSGGGGATSMCTAAIGMLLGPIDKVSTGAVSVLSDANGVKQVFVDASAGGINAQDSNPRVYVDLATAMRVDVTDVAAAKSSAWDLAIKRPVLFTNDGDGGPGMGGTVILSKAFDQVTAADAAGMTFATESFVDQDCNPQVDATGAVLTTLSNWYDYDQQTNKVTPMTGVTFVIRGASGKLFKLAILDYYANPDGSMGTAGGKYLLEIGAL